MDKSVITIIGTRAPRAQAGCGHDHGGCGHDHEHAGCGHDHQHAGCGHDHDHGDAGCGSSCGGCDGHSAPLSDVEQFKNLADYIMKCDMQDEIRLQFMDWTPEMPAKYPKIAGLLAEGYELPFVAIDDSIRLAGAVHPDKIIHLVNESREKRKTEEA